MGAWKWIRALPVWLQVPTLAVMGLLALALGAALGTLLPSQEEDGRPATTVTLLWLG